MRHTVAGLALTDIDHVERQLATAVRTARAVQAPPLEPEFPPETRCAGVRDHLVARHASHDPWVCLGRAREVLVEMGAEVDPRPAGSYDRDEALELAVGEWWRVEILMSDNPRAEVV